MIYFIVGYISLLLFAWTHSYIHRNDEYDPLDKEAGFGLPYFDAYRDDLENK